MRSISAKKAIPKAELGTADFCGLQNPQRPALKSAGHFLLPSVPGIGASFCTVMHTPD